MLKEVLVGTAVWLVSNKTGNKIAVQGFKMLCRAGNYAVSIMPKDVADVFLGTETIVKGIVSDENVQRSMSVPQNDKK